MQRIGQACPGNQKKKKRIRKRQRAGKMKKKKKRKKKKRQRPETRKKKEKKKQCIGRSPCASVHRHFRHLSIKLPSLSFFPFWRELFGESKEKTLGPNQHFPLSLFQPNTLQKVFFPHFLSFFFSSSLKSPLPNTPSMSRMLQCDIFRDASNL